MPCPGFVPLAGNDSRRQARIGEARARRRPRRFRGWLCAELSPTHWIGGDARHKAENRARQFFRQARLNEKKPRSVLGGLAARVAPVIRGVSADSAKQRDADEQPPQNATRAEGQRQFSPHWGTILAQAPRRGKEELESRWGSANASPNAAPRARRVNDLVGTNKGTLLAQRPFGRGARAEFFFLCRWESRRKRLSTRASALASQPNRTAQPRQPGTHRQIGPRPTQRGPTRGVSR